MNMNLSHLSLAVLFKSLFFSENTHYRDKFSLIQNEKTRIKNLRYGKDPSSNSKVAGAGRIFVRYRSLILAMRYIMAKITLLVNKTDDKLN